MSGDIEETDEEGELEFKDELELRDYNDEKDWSKYSLNTKTRLQVVNVLKKYNGG